MTENSESPKNTENQDTNLENEVQTEQNESDIKEPVEKTPEDKIAELEQKLVEANDKTLRCLAELDNVRRRSKEELEKSAKFAISNFVSDLVVVAENFFLASENAPKDEIEANAEVKKYADAMSMTEKELMKVLEKNKVTRIAPLNEKFDHNLHQALSQVESDAEEGTVIQVIQAGYSVHERLIRPALVAVAKAKSE